MKIKDWAWNLETSSTRNRKEWFVIGQHEDLWWLNTTVRNCDPSWTDIQPIILHSSVNHNNSIEKLSQLDLLNNEQHYICVCNTCSFLPRIISLVHFCHITCTKLAHPKCCNNIDLFSVLPKASSSLLRLNPYSTLTTRCSCSSTCCMVPVNSL